MPNLATRVYTLLSRSCNNQFSLLYSEAAKLLINHMEQKGQAIKTNIVRESYRDYQLHNRYKYKILSSQFALISTGTVLLPY